MASAFTKLFKKKPKDKQDRQPHSDDEFSHEKLNRTGLPSSSDQKEHNFLYDGSRIGRKIDRAKENLNVTMYSQVRKKPSPYDVETMPKTKKSSRSCPGGTRYQENNGSQRISRRSRYMPTVPELSDVSYENFQLNIRPSRRSSLLAQYDRDQKEFNRNSVIEMTKRHSNGINTLKNSSGQSSHNKIRYDKAQQATSTSEYGSGESPTVPTVDQIIEFARTRKDVAQQKNKYKYNKYIRSSSEDEGILRANYKKYQHGIEEYGGDDDAFVGDDDSDLSSNDSTPEHLVEVYSQHIKRLTKELKAYKEGYNKYRKKYMQLKASIQTLAHFEKANVQLARELDLEKNKTSRLLVSLQSKSQAQQNLAKQLENQQQNNQISAAQHMQVSLDNTNTTTDDLNRLQMQQHFHQQNNPFQHNQMNGQMAAVLFSQAQQQQYHHLLMYGRNGAGEALASTSTITSAAQPGTSTPNFPIYSNQLAVQTTPQIQTQIQHHHFDPTTAPQQQFAPTIAKTMENPLHLLSQPQGFNAIVNNQNVAEIDEVKNYRETLKFNTSEDPTNSSIEFARRSSVSSVAIPRSPNKSGVTYSLLEEDFPKEQQDEETLILFDDENKENIDPEKCFANKLMENEVSSLVKQNVQCSKENAPQLHKNDNTLVHNTSNSDTESSDSMVWIDGQLVTKSSCLNYESETDSTNSTRTEQRHSKRSLSDSALADGAVVVSLDSIPLLEKSNTSASEALALKMESFRNTKQRNGWNRRSKFESSIALNNSSSDEAAANFLSKRVEHLRSSRVRFRPPRKQIQPDRTFKGLIGPKEREAICSFHFLQEEQTDLSGLTSEDPSESEKAVVKADGDENKENVGSISPETEV